MGGKKEPASVKSFEHWESWCEGLLQSGEGIWVGHVCWDGEVSRVPGIDGKRINGAEERWW